MADEHPDLDAIVELLDGAGDQVELRLAEKPPEATRRLMHTLGVRIVIAPDGLRPDRVGVREVERIHQREQGETVSTAAFVPVYCPRPGCSWSSQRGGTAAKNDLATHERVMHQGGDLNSRDGLAALEAMDRGEPQLPPGLHGINIVNEEPIFGMPEPGGLPAPVSPEVAKPAQQKEALMVQPATRLWTREKILAGFRAFHDQHGRWPLSSDHSPLLPTRKAMNHHFGSWQAAWDAVGAGTIPRANAARAYVHGPAKPHAKKPPTSGRGPVKPKKAVEPPRPADPVEAKPELWQEPEQSVGTDALAPRPEDPEAPPAGISPLFDRLIEQRDELLAEASRLNDLSNDAAAKRDAIHQLVEQLEELTSR